MITLLMAACVFVVVFAGGAIGIQLQSALPEGYTTGGPRDTVFAVTGLVTLLLALVLGLLIWTAFGVYSAQKTSIQNMAVAGLRVDAALDEYGPEAAEGRKLLNLGIKRTIAEIWSPASDGDFVTKNYRSALSNLKERQAFLNTLQPSSDKQKAALAEATQATELIGQTRLQMALALVDPISIPLLSIVVAWATCLFCGYGLLSKRHLMSYIVLAVGAVAVASAFEVIVDLSGPYSGLFRVSPHPLTDVLKAIDASAK
jgi:hypothetical protein